MTSTEDTADEGGDDTASLDASVGSTDTTDQSGESDPTNSDDADDTGSDDTDPSTDTGSDPTSGGDDESMDSGAPPDDGIDVEALLAMRCGACHNDISKTGGLDLASPGVADRVSGAKSTGCEEFTIANPQDPTASLLYLKVSDEGTDCGDPMPPAPLPALDAEEQRALRDWIAGLAPPVAEGNCKPRETRVCEGVGNAKWWPDLTKTGAALAKEEAKICKQPTQTCAADGSSWGPCEGMLPSVEDCSTEADEDCNVDTPAATCSEDSWAFSVTGDRSQWFDSASVDAEGNVYILGTFSGILDFGGGPLSSDVPGGQYKNDLFLGKYDRYGTHVWSKRFGDTSNQYSTQLAVDPESGDIAIVMRLFGGVQFGNDSPSYVQKGSSDFVVALFDSEGNHQWSQQFGGRGLDRAERIVFSRDNGDVIVGGKVGFNADLQLSIPGHGSVTPRGQADGLVVRMDRSDGEVKWYHLAGGRELDVTPASTTDGGVAIDPEATSGDDDYVFGVDTDAAGDVFITGRFEGYFDFEGLDGEADSVEVKAAGGHDIFVVKLDGGTGAPLWSRHFGGEGDDRAYDLALQPGSGNVLVTGYFSGEMDVGANADGGSSALQANGGADDDDVLLLGLDASTGETLLAQGYGDDTSQFGVAHEVGKTTRNLSLAVDEDDNVYVGGFLYGSWDGRIAATGGSTSKPDLFYVKLSPDGEYQNGRVYGTAGSELGYDLALDPATHSVIMVGRFYGSTFDLGPAGTVLGTKDISSAFAVKWAQP